MTLDDLKTAWADLDRQLTDTRTAVRRLQTGRSLDLAKSALRPLAWRLAWELLQALGAVVVLVLYLAWNFAETRFALPGVALLALAAVGFAATVWQLTALRRLDYTAPVVDTQRRLAGLRAFRLRVGLGVVFASPLVWALGVIVLPRAVGVDVFDGVGWPWVVANFAFAVVFLVAGVAATRALAARFRGSRWLATLADDLAGRSLTRAAEQVRQAAEFATTS